MLRLGPDDELAFVLLGNFFLQSRDVAAEILSLGGIGEQRADALDVEVFGDVVIRAVAHRFDCRVELFRLRDDDGLDVGVVLPRDLQHLEAADAAQMDLEEHQVHVFLLHHLQCGFARRGSEHAIVASQGGSQ